MCWQVYWDHIWCLKKNLESLVRLNINWAQSLSGSTLIRLNLNQAQPLSGLNSDKLNAIHNQPNHQIRNVNFLNSLKRFLEGKILKTCLRWDLQVSKIDMCHVVLSKVEYSQTWVNDHLRITTTTCLQRPQFLGPNFNFYNIKLPLNNDHLSITATNYGSRGGSLLVIHKFDCISRLNKRANNTCC